MSVSILKKENMDVASYNVRVQGIENLDSSDFTIPRIRLLQFLSKEVGDGTGKAGELVNSLTGENYGESLLFIPIMVQKGRIRFVDKELRCRSNDAINGIGEPGGSCATCPLAEWGDDKEAPECSLVYNYPSIILPQDGESGEIPDGIPTAVSLTKTSTAAARKLNTMLKFDAKGSVYELFSVKRENQKGRFYVFDVRKKRALTPNERQAVAELAQFLAGKNIEVEQTPESVFEAEADTTKNEPY